MESEIESRKPEGKRAQERRDLAACYARVFLGDEDGRRVLADLRQKWGVGRLVFVPRPHHPFDPLAAAIREGERRPMIEIEAALKDGAPLQLSTATEQNPNP